MLNMTTIKRMDELIQAAKQQTNTTLIVACAADAHVVKAVEKARKEDIIKPILVGDKQKITTILRETGADPNLYEIVDEPDDITACETSVKLVHENPRSILMKGLVATSTILKAALNKEYGLRTGNRISHVTVMETQNYHKLLLMTDGAMNIAPTLDDKRQIIENAVSIANSIGIDTPYVGVVAAVEKVNPNMPATLDAKELIELNEKNVINGCVVAGPFAIDNAINLEAAKHKGITHPAAGNVDILLMPDIEAGNVFYKTMMFLANAKSASVIAGATHPIVLTSRADDKQTKFQSIALASLVVNK